jgi:hypothetical protein
MRASLCLIGSLLCLLTGCTPSKTATVVPVTPVAPGSSVFGVFEGITPCSAQTRPLPQIPKDTNCEQMIWEFTLFQDSATGAPTTYQLDAAYGVPKQNTTGLEKGGTPITMEGNWQIVKGTSADPKAVVYQLNPLDSQMTVSFLKVSEDILHVLHPNMRLMVGNASWSYTINRTDNRRAPQIVVPAEPPTSSTPLVIPPMPEGATVLGIFEGRTPCHTVVFEFTGIAPHEGCFKVKWQLTLYQEQNTNAPTSYLFRGTGTVRTGTWAILQGTKNDPDALVYQLREDDSQQLTSFLRVGDDHLFLLDRELNLLVGNALFSYTLSRTDKAVK